MILYLLLCWCHWKR